MSALIRGIALAGSAAYLRRVSMTRLIRFLTVLALVLSPLATIGASPALAMAHHSAMASSGHQMAGHKMAGHDMGADASKAAMTHCQDMDGKSKDQPCGSEDCQTACAAVPAIPAIGGQLVPHAMPHGPQLLPALVSAPNGLDPEAATPPPRKLLTI